MPRPWTFALWSLLNHARFALRRLSFRPRRGLSPVAEPWETLFPEGSEIARSAARLRSRYALDWPDEHANQRENLHVVGMLEAALEPLAASLPESLDVLDIGAKDWHYVRGVHRFLSRVGTKTPRRVRMIGIEADPFHRYRDGFTRHDYARHYAEGLAAEYRAGDAREERGAYDLVLLLHPFWRERDLLDWGLPSAYFAIEALLEHARGRLKPGGVLLVTAYRSEERWAKETLRRLAWEPVEVGVWRSPYLSAAPSLYWTFSAQSSDS